MQIVIERIYQSEECTLGNLFVYDNKSILYECKTLELPWKENQKRISRIPSNHYPASKHISPKFGKSIWIKEVEDRSEILIHVGNYPEDTLGCILVGEAFSTGCMITNSRRTINKLYDIADDNLYVNIIDKWKN